MSDEEKKDTTEIEKKKDTALVKPNDFKLPESIDGLDPQDLRLSNLFICQDQSNKARDKGVGPGMLYDNQTFDAFEKLEVIMFYKFDSRILYGLDPGDPIRCFSPNGKTPEMSPSIHNDCITCQENIKSSDKLQPGQSKYGDCNRTFNFACIKPNITEGSEEDFAFLISMQRMNMPLGKQIINMLMRRRQELFMINRLIQTEQVSNEKGRWYKFKITDSAPTNQDDIERAKYWLQFLKAMQKAQKLIIDIQVNEEEKNITPNEDIPF
jgi:hypothetical protein